MRKSEIAILLAGTIATFVFVGYMFDYYLRIEEVQLVRKNIYYDSLLLEENKKLKVQDSILQNLIMIGDTKIDNKVKGASKDIHNIYKTLDTLGKKK